MAPDRCPAAVHREIEAEIETAQGVGDLEDPPCAQRALDEGDVFEIEIGMDRSAGFAAQLRDLPPGEEAQQIEPVGGFLHDQPSAGGLPLDPPLPLVPLEGTSEVIEGEGLDRPDGSRIDESSDLDYSRVKAELVVHGKAATRRSQGSADGLRLGKGEGQRFFHE
jgi:hypothetical protein